MREFTAALAAVGIAAVLAGATVQIQASAVEVKGAVGAIQGPVEKHGTFGSMQVVCRSSHTNSDDPIVYPGQRGAAHQHDFFGNRSTDAFSKLRNLRGKRTTCSRPGDTAAYWTPTLLKNGHRVAPDRVIAYYRTSRIRDIHSIRPFPPGLKMIAGSATASRSNPQPRRIVNWNCGDGVKGTVRPPRACPNKPLRLRVEFPNCWDGRRLDSANHKRHMAYAGRRGVRGCPRSHPVAVPSLSLNFRWKISGSLRNVRLSSGGVYSGHADFFNSWKKKALRRLVHNCLNTGRVCSSGIADAPRAAASR